MSLVGAGGRLAWARASSVTAIGNLRELAFIGASDYCLSRWWERSQGGGHGCTRRELLAASRAHLPVGATLPGLRGREGHRSSHRRLPGGGRRGGDGRRHRQGG